MTDDRSETTEGQSDPDGDALAEDKNEPKTKPRKRKPNRPERGGERTSSKGKRPSAAAVPVSDPANKSGSVLIVALVAVAIGVGIGWLARGPSAETSAAATPSASASAASAACDQWVEKLCKEAGESSEACGSARSAANLLPAAACEAANTEIPATMARIQSARSACDELVTKLCADIGQDTESCKLVKEKTPSFPTAQCKEMLEGYDDVVAELRQMERKNAPLTREAAAAQGAGNGPSFGPANAKVTVVEYSDFECPFCSRAAAVVKKLKENYSDRVRFVFRQFPLPMHRNAALASEAALEAHAQGKFWAFHDKLFENQRALDRASIEGYAQQLGLNMTQFKKALDEGNHRGAIEADKTLGDQIGVNGTPTMIVNTKRVSDPTNYAALAALIDAELAAAN